jgi:type II secretory pathway pseudopilin PulG
MQGAYFLKNKNKKAFTLVDILVSSIIIVLIMGVLFAAYQEAMIMLSVSRHRLEAVILCHRALEMLKTDSFAFSPALDTFGTPTIRNPVSFDVHDITTDPLFCNLPAGSMQGTTNAELTYRVEARFMGMPDFCFSAHWTNAWDPASGSAPPPVITDINGNPLRDGTFNNIVAQRYTKRLVVRVTWTENLTGRNFEEAVSLLIVPEQSIMVPLARN